jgi:hypothetical protein
MKGTARLVLALCLLLPGCGYSLVGRGIAIDPSIKRIGVPLFKDTKGKAGLDQLVTRKVIEELLKRHRFDVVQESTGVDALVEGTITDYRVVPVGFGASGVGGTTGQTQASRYSISLTVSVRYTKVGQTEPIWENGAYNYSDEYDIGDANTFFEREDQTLERLTTTFARNLISAMLEAF